MVIFYLIIRKLIWVLFSGVDELQWIGLRVQVNCFGKERFCKPWLIKIKTMESLKHFYFENENHLLTIKVLSKYTFSEKTSFDQSYHEYKWTNKWRKIYRTWDLLSVSLNTSLLVIRLCLNICRFRSVRLRRWLQLKYCRITPGMIRNFINNGVVVYCQLQLMLQLHQHQTFQICLPKNAPHMSFYKL